MYPWWTSDVNTCLVSDVPLITKSKSLGREWYKISLRPVWGDQKEKRNKERKRDGRRSGKCFKSGSCASDEINPFSWLDFAFEIDLGVIKGLIVQTETGKMKYKQSQVWSASKRENEAPSLYHMKHDWGFFEWEKDFRTKLTRVSDSCPATGVLNSVKETIHRRLQSFWGGASRGCHVGAHRRTKKKPWVKNHIRFLSLTSWKEGGGK